jgi:hypothetical protein
LAETFERRARFREGMFDWRGALADLDRAVALGATANRYVWRSGLYQQVKDDAKALADLKAAEALEPDSIPVQLTLAGFEAEHG